MVLSVSGCGVILSSATSDMARHLKDAIANNSDPETVREAVPAYLLMLDSLLEKNPSDVNLLSSAATLNGSYADLFIEDHQRSKRLTEKALRLAMKAACIDMPKLCNPRKMPYETFEKHIQMTTKPDVPLLFTLGGSWAGWIQTHRKDWNAVADIARVELIMHRVLKLDPHYRDGMAHLYLGVIATILPEAMGGKPEQGRSHFEKAIEISLGKNLMAKVLYARQYARLVFDRDLHDELLTEVLDADPQVEGYALSNHIAQIQAKTLMDGADEYF